MKTVDIKTWSDQLQQKLIDRARDAEPEDTMLLGEAACLLAAITAEWSQIDRLKAAFHTNMLRAYPDKTHEEIHAEIARILKTA